MRGDVMTSSRRIARVLALLLLGALLAVTAVGATCGEEDESEPTPTVEETATPEPEPTDTPRPTRTVRPTEEPAREAVTVVRVIDGDTIEIEGGERVRYIGVDTPESTTRQECFGAEATRRNRELLEGREVELEKDVSETDRYGRLLRYIWADGELVNEALVREGFAVVSTYPPDVKYQEGFLAAQQEARAAGAGLWSACGSADAPLQPPPAPATNRANCDTIRDTPYLSIEERDWFRAHCITPAAPQPVVPVVPGSGSGASCHPSYQGACLDPNGSDYDCAGGPGNGPLYTGPVRVVGPDVFGLDGSDHDGLGCE